MLEPLGDPYTRFLPPAQYDSLYGLATGSVAGVGVSLFIDPVSGGGTPTAARATMARFRIKESIDRPRIQNESVR